jgi:hypothetical protein
MGKAPNDVDIPAVTAEIDTLRERTQALVAELEQRLRSRVQSSRRALARVRHVVDIRGQLREHPTWVLGIGVLLLGVGMVVVVLRARAARLPLPRLRARLLAKRALSAQPERALRSSLGERLLGAILITAATTVTRALSGLVVKRALTTRQLHA